MPENHFSSQLACEYVMMTVDCVLLMLLSSQGSDSTVDAPYSIPELSDWNLEPLARA